MADPDSKARAGESGRGRDASAPQEVPAAGWKDILWRTWGEISNDRVTLIAAGVTYYLLLALFPALTAFVSLYGLFTEPATVQEHVNMLSTIVPAGGMEIISEQLQRLTSNGGSTLGLALFISLALALWSASSGVKSLFEAMNVAYDERETRNFFVLNGLALGFTLGGVIAAVVMIGIVVILPAIVGFLPIPGGLDWLLQVVGYLLLVAVLFVGIAALYRFGPSRQQAKWRWVTPGAVVAVVVIGIVSILFSWYTANFGNYDATYGSLGALIGLLTWMWITVTIVIVGGELNSEAEHQTHKDSTVGADDPLGQRNATMADTVGKSTDEGGDAAGDPNTESDDYKAGYKAAAQRYKPAPRRLSAGSLAFAVPAALAVRAMRRREPK